MVKIEKTERKHENGGVLARMSPESSDSRLDFLVKPNSDAMARYNHLAATERDSVKFRIAHNRMVNLAKEQEVTCKSIAKLASVSEGNDAMVLVPEIANKYGWELTETGLEAVDDYISIIRCDRDLYGSSESVLNLFDMLKYYHMIKNNSNNVLRLKRAPDTLFEPIATSEVVTGKIVNIYDIKHINNKFNKGGIISISAETDGNWFDLSETDLTYVLDKMQPDYVVAELTADFYNHNYLYINKNSYITFKVHFKGGKTAYLTVIPSIETVEWLGLDCCPSPKVVWSIVGSEQPISKFYRIWDAICIANYCKDKSIKSKARDVFNDQFVIDEAFSRPFGLMQVWIKKRWNFNRFTTKFGWKATEFDDENLQKLSDEIFKEGGSLDFQLTSFKDWNSIMAQFRAKFEELELEELERDQFEDKLDSEWKKLNEYYWNDNFQNEEVLIEAFKPSKAWRAQRKTNKRANRGKVFTIPCEDKTKTAHEVMMDIGSVKLPVSNSKPHGDKILPKQEGEDLNRFKWKEMKLYKDIRDCRVYNPRKSYSVVPIWKTTEGKGFLLYNLIFKVNKKDNEKKSNKGKMGKKARKPLPFGNRVAKRTILTKAIWGAFEFDVLDEIIEFQVYKEVVKELRGK